MKSRDITKRWYILAIISLIAVKLILGLTQYVYLTPYSAPIDDMLMYDAAFSIVKGRWLGEYGWLTLSKYYFFAVWLAALNILHIPYLLGGQLLWLCAVGVCTAALAPVLRKNIFKLIFFAALLFNPAQMAAEVELRVYRDNIFPALCLLCIGGFVGAALRYSKPLRQYMWYIAAAAIGLATAYTTREDGLWLLPFAIGACITVIVFIARSKPLAHKDVRIMALALPYISVCGLILVFCCINYSRYGRFVFSDFTSREFKDAYGAMTRVEHEDFKMQVAVPKDVRDKLYANVPELAVIQPILERNWYYARYGSEKDEEFSTGGFHWALREAAGEAGVYQSANGARDYWRSVADKINELCDNGTLKAGPRRSSTTPPIRAEYVLPTIKEGFINVGRVLTFSEAYPAYNILSYVSVEEYDAFVSFLRNVPGTAAIANTALPYFTPVQKLANALLTVLRYAYAVVLPILFGGALIWQLSAIIDLVRRKHRDNPLFFVIMLGLLLCILLRAFMIAFMFVASFNDNIVRIMYLSSIHPIAIVYSLLGCGLLIYKLRHKGEKLV